MTDLLSLYSLGPRTDFKHVVQYCVVFLTYLLPFERLFSAFVLPGTLQSSYTGAQLRSAATMYALMVDGLFGPANWEAVKAQARFDISRRRSTRLRQDGGTVAFSAPAASAPGGAAGLPAPGTYNWEPFFQRFGDMTPQDAMTSVMAAFGRLVSDFYGYNQPSTAPTRAERAARVRQQAQDFALGMVQPLFGSKRSTKLHEALCHAADEIELREDFSMADTSLNEQKHKLEKAAYRRTNRQTASSGRQLLTVAQARVVLQREEALAARATHAAQPEEEDRTSQVSDEDSDEDSSDDGEPISTGLPLGRGFRGTRVPVEQLAKRPGLCSLAALLGLPGYAHITLLTGIHFTATYEWNALPCVELLRSSEMFCGAAWRDCVIFRRHAGDHALFGLVRLIVAGGSADATAEPRAVVQCMQAAVPLPGAALAAAGYDRLCWAFDDDTAEWPTLAVVPLSGLQRIAHVVPDVQVRTPSGEVTQPTPGEDQEAGKMRSQVFLNNILFKSTTPAQQRAQRLRAAKTMAV